MTRLAMVIGDQLLRGKSGVSRRYIVIPVFAFTTYNSE